MTLSNIDITSEDLIIVKELLKKFIPNIVVWAYGSRVKMTARATSDLDLVAFANKDETLTISDLRDAFDESNLPFEVDILIWEDIPDDFKQNIKEKYVVLQ